MGTRLPRASQSAGHIRVYVGEGRREGAEQGEDITFFCFLQREGVLGLWTSTADPAHSQRSRIHVLCLSDGVRGRRQRRAGSSSLVLGGDSEEDKPL